MLLHSLPMQGLVYEASILIIRQTLLYAHVLVAQIFQTYLKPPRQHCFFSFPEFAQWLLGIRNTVTDVTGEGEGEGEGGSGTSGCWALETPSPTSRARARARARAAAEQ